MQTFDVELMSNRTPHPRNLVPVRLVSGGDDDVTSAEFVRQRQGLLPLLDPEEERVLRVHHGIGLAPEEQLAPKARRADAAARLAAMERELVARLAKAKESQPVPVEDEEATGEEA